MKKLNILIVDDSLITIRRISEIVTRSGHEVIATARSGMMAITEYKANRPDIVTMDITMPDMDGIQTTKKIIEYDPEAIIVMATAHGQEKMVIEAMMAGAKGYLLKPLEQEKVVQTLEEIYQNYSKKD